MNSDKQCDSRDLVAVMTGNFYVEGGGAESIYTAYSEGRIKEEKFAIDLYVWFEESKGQDQNIFITSSPTVRIMPRCVRCLAPIRRSMCAHSAIKASAFQHKN